MKTKVNKINFLYIKQCMSQNQLFVHKIISCKARPNWFSSLRAKWQKEHIRERAHTNQLVSLKFKNYLHTSALHMITFHYWEILICHILIKIWKTCVIYLNWIVSLKTQHASKGQAPHVLIISVLTKCQCFLIHLLSRLAFPTTIV